MKACEGSIGRVYVIRLEDNDIVPDCIEKFASENKITSGHVFLIGGVWKGQVVVGPKHSDKLPPDPMLLPLDGAHEVIGFGLLTTGNNGKPNLHMHAAMGRAGQTITGCLREGVTTWLVGEVIIYEITGLNVMRKRDEQSGFDLLVVGVSQNTK